MPSLCTFTVTDTHTDGNGITLSSHPSFIVKAHNNATLLGAGLTSQRDMHVDYTITPGFVGIITAHENTDIPGTTGTITVAASQTIIGTGSPAAAYIVARNFSNTTNETFTNNGNMAHIGIHKVYGAKHVASGF